MHMPSTTSPSSHTHSVTSRSATRETHAKADPNDQENVQRFRKLMDGKQQRSADSSAQDSPEGESSVDISADADADTNANDNDLPPDQEQALRNLLQRQLSQGSGSTAGISSRGQDSDSGGGSDQQDDHRDGQAGNIGMQVLHMAQQAIVQNAEQPSATTQASMGPALAELIERHVKQLLVPDATSQSSAQAREIMITLKDGLLPGTELWLSRTSTGWKLRADTRSSEAYRSMIESAPQLIERFAQSRLGSLEVDPTLLT